MYCPHCSAQITQKQKFCRSCGMDLKLVAQALAQHLSETGIKKGSSRSEAAALNLLYKMLLGGVSMLMAGMVVLALGKEIPWVKTIGMLMVLTGTFIAFLGVISPLRPRKQPLQSSLPESATGTQTTAKLPKTPMAEMLPSVTEDATRSLGISTKEIPKVLP